MDLTALASRAKYKLGDKVRLQAGDTWTVTGRFYRRSTREIVYDITVHRINYTVRKAERELFPARE